MKSFKEYLKEKVTVRQINLSDEISKDEIKKYQKEYKVIIKLVKEDKNNYVYDITGKEEDVAEVAEKLE